MDNLMTLSDAEVEELNKIYDVLMSISEPSGDQTVEAVSATSEEDAANDLP